MVNGHIDMFTKVNRSYLEAEKSAKVFDDLIIYSN